METTSHNDVIKVLIAEDEALNQAILEDIFMNEDYIVTIAEDGEKAWMLLEEYPNQYDVVLLDWMMPKMYGIEVLKRMKEHPLLRRIPVILQTAQAEKSRILEGLEAGAYYYLTKPLQKEHLLAIMRTAVEEFHHQKELFEEARKLANTLTLMGTGSFSFASLEEGENLAILLAKTFPFSNKLVLGLNELFTNSVEHGNLGITYDEKSVLMETGGWRKEVLRRMDLPENRDKKVKVTFENTGEELRFLITDQGCGFDWRTYLDFSPERLFDLHGRGIAISNSKCFDHLEYHDPGNEVLGIVKLK